VPPPAYVQGRGVSHDGRVEREELVEEAVRGERRAVDSLVERLYDELRRLAERKLRAERADHTLRPTALVHEAYLRLVPQAGVDWKGRTHFLCVAAEQMSRILKDHAGARDCQKRGRGWQKVTLDEGCALAPRKDIELVDFIDAIERLEESYPREAKVAMLKLLGGLLHKEIADLLDLSIETIGRDWRFARASLAKSLEAGLSHA
jgi:RNA polymerase sigma factor (TIGR02999 family)